MLRGVALIGLLSVLHLNGIYAQNLILVTWNIQNMGRTKSDQEIQAMAQILREADIVAIQEVTAKDPAGAQAVARLADALSRTGANWECRISDPTSCSSNQSERYAFLWKTSRATLLGNATLAVQMADTVRREPYIARFRTSLGEITLINFHAVPHDQQPEREIKIVRNLAFTLGDKPVIFLADWNVVDHHTVFNPLTRMGYHFALKGQRTTLKRQCAGTEYRNHGIDNILLSPVISVQRAGVYDFVGNCANLEAARRISDHLPVWAEVGLAIE